MMTLAQMLPDLRRQNSPVEVLHVAVLPNAATPWGLYRQLLREADARRAAIRDLLISAEGHRRGALWASLTLRPLRARGLRLSAQDAETQARETAEVLCFLEAWAAAARQLLPPHLSDETVAELEANDLMERLARQIRAARGREVAPAPEVAAAVDCLPVWRQALVFGMAENMRQEIARAAWVEELLEKLPISKPEQPKALEAAW